MKNMEFSILQALKHNAKSRMTQNIGVLCHQCTLYIVQVMGELVIFKTVQPYLTCKKFFWGCHNAVMSIISHMAQLMYNHHYRLVKRIEPVNN